MLNISVFTDAYIPKRLVGRNKQLQTLRESISLFKKNKITASHILLGVTGSGKTATLLYALQEQLIRGEDYLFVDCKEHNTTRKALAELGGAKLRETSTAAGVIDHLDNKLKEKNRIIILDDIGRVHDFPKLIDMLNALYRKYACPLFITTNKPMLEIELPHDARMTFFFEKIFFPKYSPLELKEIVVDRLREAGAQLPDEIIQHIVALATPEGSARMALDITRRMLEIGGQDENSLRRVMRGIELQEFMDVLNGMPKSELQVLFYITKTAIMRAFDGKWPDDYEKVKKLERVGKVRSGDIVSDLDMNLKTVNRILLHLEKEVGVIHTQMRYGGREGNYKLAWPSDYFMNKVKNYFEIYQMVADQPLAPTHRSILTYHQY
jgi:Cdc6-like AAA superfamily ATPase